MSAEPNLTEQDYELLSAYIDDMLAADERSALEQRLEDEPALRRELAALRSTVALVNNLPPMVAPRNFTLTPEMVGAQPRRVIPFPVVSLMSAAAAVILMVAGLLLLTSQPAAPTAETTDTVAIASTATETLAPSPLPTNAPTQEAAGDEFAVPREEESAGDAIPEADAPPVDPAGASAADAGPPPNIEAMPVPATPSPEIQALRSAEVTNEQVPTVSVLTRTPVPSPPVMAQQATSPPPTAIATLAPTEEPPAVEEITEDDEPFSSSTLGGAILVVVGALLLAFALVRARIS